MVRYQKKTSDINYYFFDADKPFKDFSKAYPHGWGIGWYEDDKAKVFKQGEDDTVYKSQKYDFERVRGVTSNTIIAHLRETHHFDYSTKNAHPFEFKNWIFAHNGGVNRDNALDYLTDEFKESIASNASSEVLFRLILQNLAKSGDMPSALGSTLDVVRGTNYKSPTFLMSDGNKMYGYRNSIPEQQNIFPLHYTTPGHTKGNKSVVFSSEPLTKDEKWIELKLGQLVTVDGEKIEIDVRSL